MAERFFNNDEEEQYFEEDGEEFDEEAVAFVDQDGLLGVMQMDLAQSELNQDLISKAISIASNSWFWRFKNTSSKMKEIGEIYKQLMDMTNDNEQEEGNERHI